MSRTLDAVTEIRTALASHDAGELSVEQFLRCVHTTMDVGVYRELCPEAWVRPAVKPKEPDFGSLPEAARIALLEMLTNAQGSA